MILAEIITGLPDWLTIPLGILGWIGGMAILVSVGRFFK